MTSLGALQTSLAWWERVSISSRDPDQRKRAAAAIARLEAEIEAHTKKEEPK